MSARRRTQLVLLCEDTQHETFLYRFFVKAGWHPRSITVQKSPAGRGAADRWVLDRFPRELSTLRSRHVTASLVAMVDCDLRELPQRMAAFEASCEAVDVLPRGPGDSVALFAPRRNIETWIAYLSGDDVNELHEYPKLPRQGDCEPAVKALKAMCDRGELRETAPPSLESACDEYQTRLAGGGKR